MPERVGSRQEPPNIVHCHDEKLDLGVFKGSFWGWFVPVTLNMPLLLLEGGGDLP
jgi:hypothetical protein